MSPEKIGNGNVSVPPRAGGPPAPAVEYVRPLRPTPQVNTVRDYISLFFKHQVLVASVFLSIVVLAVGYFLFIYEPRFQAKAILMVKFGWENFSQDFSKESRRVPTVSQGEVINSEVRILQSRDLKDRVVNTLKPETLYPQLIQHPVPGLSNHDAAVFMIEKDLTVTPGKGNMIEVAMSGGNSARGAAIVNQLVNYYIEKRSEIYKDPKSTFFLEKKAEEFRQKLYDTEAALRAFREETNIVAFDEQRTALLKQQSDLLYIYNNVVNDVAGMEKTIKELDRQLNSIPKYSQTSETALSYRIRETEQKILELRLKEQDLLAKYKEDNRLIENVRESLKLTEAFMDRQRKVEMAQVMDPVWASVYKDYLKATADQDGHKAKRGMLEQQLLELGKEMQTFEGLEQRHKELVRTVVDNEEKYKQYRQRLEEAKIYDELERQKMTSVSIVQNASESAIPVNPQRPLFILIPAVLAVGILGSLGITYLLELLNHRISTPAEAEKRLGIPVLVTIREK